MTHVAAILLALSSDDVLKWLITALHEHWPKALSAIALTGGGWWLGRWRAQSEWRKRQFLGRLNVSLNTFCDGQLLIRTIFEKSLDAVLLNTHAVEIVRKAAELTTEMVPLVILPKADAWFILNSVLNDVAEMFCEGPMRRDLGLPVTTAQFVLCLTRERAGGIRIQKVRAMLIQKSTLFNLPDALPRLENENHVTRFETLKSLARLYPTHTDQFLEIEIAV